MEKTPKVLIGLPTMSSIHIWLAITIMSWVAENKVSVRVYPTLNVQPVDNARNAIVEEFLHGEAKDCTHLFFIDSDTIPPQDAIYKLLAHNKDIVSGITAIVDHDEKLKDNESGGYYKKWNCVGMDEKHVKPHTGLLPVKGAGGSCLLIKREVFEKIEEPYFRFVYQDDNGKKVLVSEDIYFIAKALGKGIQTYADTSVVCQHQKSILW